MQNGATGGSLQTTYLNLLRSCFLAYESGHNETSRFGGGNASDAVVGTRKVPSVPVFEHLVFSRWRCFFLGGGGYVIFRRRSLAGGTGVGLEALQPGVTSFPLCMDSDYQGGVGLLLPCIPHHKGLYPSGTVSLKKPFWSLSCFSSRRLSRQPDLDNKLWRWIWCLQYLQYQPLRG